MIKIVHFLPTINYTSGVASTIMNYYRKINKSKIQFDFITFLENNKNSYRGEIEKRGGKVLEITSPRNFLKFIRQFRSIIKSYKNENIIFHNHQINFTILIYFIIKKELNCKFIVHNHTSRYSDKILSAIRNYFMCLPIRFLNVERFACSKCSGELVYGKKKFYIMENSIDLKKFEFNEEIREKYRKKFNIENKFVIGHIGHFERVKNHSYIIKVFMRLIKKNSDFVLFLIGNGSLKNKFNNLINKLGIKDKVIILENRNDINCILNAFDIFIFPSKFEGLGLAAVEAQANGLPVIMSDKVPPEVNLSNAYIIKINKNSINSWKDKIIEVRNNKIDRKKIAFVKKSFSIEESCKELEKKYYEMIGCGSE